MGTDGVHLNRVVKRSKIGIQEEMKGPRGPESQGDCTGSSQTKATGLSDMATRRLACQKITEDRRLWVRG